MFEKTLQPIVVFHIESSHLFCRVKQVTGFYIRRKTGLKWVTRQTKTYVYFSYSLQRVKLIKGVFTTFSSVVKL